MKFIYLGLRDKGVRVWQAHTKEAVFGVGLKGDKYVAAFRLRDHGGTKQTVIGAGILTWAKAERLCKRKAKQLRNGIAD